MNEAEESGKIDGNAGGTNGASAASAGGPLPGTETEYIVEKVMGKQILNGQTWYFLKWLGWSEQDNTWEPLENCTKCSNLISEYEDELKRQADALAEPPSEPSDDPDKSSDDSDYAKRKSKRRATSRKKNSGQHKSKPRNVKYKSVAYVDPSSDEMEKKKNRNIVKHKGKPESMFINNVYSNGYGSLSSNNDSGSSNERSSKSKHKESKKQHKHQKVKDRHRSSELPKSTSQASASLGSYSEVVAKEQKAIVPISRSVKPVIPRVPPESSSNLANENLQPESEWDKLMKESDSAYDERVKARSKTVKKTEKANNAVPSASPSPFPSEMGSDHAIDSTESSEGEVYETLSFGWERGKKIVRVIEWYPFEGRILHFVKYDDNETEYVEDTYTIEHYPELVLDMYRRHREAQAMKAESTPTPTPTATGTPEEEKAWLDFAVQRLKSGTTTEMFMDQPVNEKMEVPTVDTALNQESPIEIPPVEEDNSNLNESMAHTSGYSADRENSFPPADDVVESINTSSSACVHTFPIAIDSASVRVPVTDDDYPELDLDFGDWNKSDLSALEGLLDGPEVDDRLIAGVSEPQSDSSCLNIENTGTTIGSSVIVVDNTAQENSVFEVQEDGSSPPNLGSSLSSINQEFEVEEGEGSGSSGPGPSGPTFMMNLKSSDESEEDKEDKTNLQENDYELSFFDPNFTLPDELFSRVSLNNPSDEDNHFLSLDCSHPRSHSPGSSYPNLPYINGLNGFQNGNGFLGDGDEEEDLAFDPSPPSSPIAAS